MAGTFGSSYNTLPRMHTSWPNTYPGTRTQRRTSWRNLQRNGTVCQRVLLCISQSILVVDSTGTFHWTCVHVAHIPVLKTITFAWSCCSCDTLETLLWHSCVMTVFSLSKRVISCTLFIFVHSPFKFSDTSLLAHTRCYMNAIIFIWF